MGNTIYFENDVQYKYPYENLNILVGTLGIRGIMNNIYKINIINTLKSMNTLSRGNDIEEIV